MIKRKIYQLLLRLHPHAFRERFGTEMLWLFNETLCEEGFFKLCADALFSLAKQHIANDSSHRPASQLFQEAPHSGVSVTRCLQAGIVASVALLGFFELLAPPVTISASPKTAVVRRHLPDTCAEWSSASLRTDRHRNRRARVTH
jgi:hypothetical protein